MTSTDSAQRMIALLALFTLILAGTAIAASNDPGHDALYIQRTGDNVSGSFFNFTGALHVRTPQTGSEAATKAYVDSAGSGLSGSGQQGRVAFWTNATALSFSDNLTWNATTTRLGIGISNTTDTLHVNGTIRIQSLSSALGIYQDVNADVGIGTATPQQKLNVLGTFNATGAAIFGNSICTAGQVLSTTSTGQLQCVTDTIGGSSAAGWTNTSVDTNTSLNVGITAGNLTVGSRLGIGTTALAHTLTVNGTTNLTGAVLLGNSICVAGQVLSTTSTGQIECVTDTSGTGTVTSVTRGFGFNATGTSITTTGTLDINQTLIQKRITGTCSAGNSVATVNEDGTVTCEADDTGITSITLGTGLNGSANPITTSGLITLNTSYTDTRYFIKGSDNAADLQLDATNGRGIQLYGSSNYKIYMSASTDGTYGGNLTTSDYNIYSTISGGTNRGWVFKNTNAVAQIDGAGNLFLTGNVVATGTGMSSLKGNLTVINGSSSQGLYQDTNANVGIGTTLPVAKLTVAGGVMLNATASKPTCTAAQRGTFWFEQSGASSDDYMYACMKNSTESYNWILVARGG